LAAYLHEAGIHHLNPGDLIYSVDSSFQDEDDGKSTGCFIGTFMGGPIDFNSHVPNVIAMSSAEAEVNAATVGTMSAMHTRMIINEALFGPDASDRPYRVPVLLDSQAAFDISKNDKGTKRTRHIERRFLYCRHAYQSNLIDLIHVDGDKHQLADIGTKNLSSDKMAYKLSILETPNPEAMFHTLKRGVGGIPRSQLIPSSDYSHATKSRATNADPRPVTKDDVSTNTYNALPSTVTTMDSFPISKEYSMTDLIDQTHTSEEDIDQYKSTMKHPGPFKEYLEQTKANDPNLTCLTKEDEEHPLDHVDKVDLVLSNRLT